MDHVMTESPLEAALKRRDRALRWVRSQGAVFCVDSAELERLKSYLREMPHVFPLLQWGLCAIYLFRQDEQHGDLGEYDAICWRDATTDGFGVLFAVGVSTEALDKGENYTQLCFLHELSHIVDSSGHTQNFHRTLDHLIERFNYVTGSALQNDYFGP